MEGLRVSRCHPLLVRRYVITTDGSRKDFKVGEILFQDDVEDSPAAKQPKHYSGVNGDAPNQQLILQVPLFLKPLKRPLCCSIAGILGTRPDRKGLKHERFLHCFFQQVQLTSPTSKVSAEL